MIEEIRLESDPAPPETLDGDEHDWLSEGRVLIFGGRIEWRRSSPCAGWYIISDHGALGPFADARGAQAWWNSRNAVPAARPRSRRPAAPRRRRRAA